jgi:hypothetical protein
VLFDTTKVADESTRAALQNFDSSSGTMVFSSSTPILENLKVGDVIASEPSVVADGGYLRKVKSKQANGAGFMLETEPAMLLEAIKDAELHFEQPLTPANVVSAKPEFPGVRLKQSRAASCFGYCFEAFVKAVVCRW